MTEPQNIGVELLCNSSRECICPFSTSAGSCFIAGNTSGMIAGVVNSITSTETFYTGTFKAEHGVKIVIEVLSVSGTSPTLSISAQLGYFEPAIPIVSNISSTGTWVIHVAEDGTVTLNANGTLSTIGKISMPVENVTVTFTVGGTSPSFGISAWVEYV